MVASRARQPMPALPDPDERNQPQDRTRRRAQERARAPERRPRASLDSLAIGAPLTAALVGVLLTEGDAAFGGHAPGAAAAGRGVARSGADEAGLTVDPGPLFARSGAAGGGGVAGEPSGSTSGEIFDPVAAEAATAAGPPTDGESGSLAPPSAAGVPGANAAAAVGGISITIAAGAALADGLGLLESGSGAGAGGASGRIGTTIVGSAGDDVIHGTPYNDHLVGGAGNDTIYGYEGDDWLDGGSGNDQLFGGAGDDLLDGGSGDDRLFGGTGDDRLFGGIGNDDLAGEEGRDSLDGGAGNDLVDGGPGADRPYPASSWGLTGSTGDDILVVDDPHDIAFEREMDGGNDTLQVAGGFGLPAGVDSAAFVFSEHLGEALPSGAAAYRQQVGVGIENVTLEGDAAHDVLADSGDNRVTGNAGNNSLFGEGGDDTLSGGAGDDHLHGGSGGDLLSGDPGADLLEGRSGVDELHGGDGDDILDGGGGGDLLYGEAGNDSFVLGLHDSAIDTVFDHDGDNWLSIEEGAGREVQTAVAGDQLYVVVDKNPIAVVDDYLGSEGAFDGIDTGEGLRAIDDLMAPGASGGPALGGTASASAPAFHADDDLLGTYLTRPSLSGTTGADHLVGTSSSDWLSGGAGDDHLTGGGGLDVLEGGAGSDRLEGGAGADRYLFKSGEAGWSVVHDTEGANLVELDGFAGAKLGGRVIGGDLVVVANHSPIVTFEDFVGNEQAFAGVQVGDQVFSAEDLLDG